MKDISEKVTLRCDVCGNDLFSALDNVTCELCDAPDETRVQCSDCGKIFSKAELMDANQKLINGHIEDMKNEAIREIEKELKKALKKRR